jgi:acyl-CoA thioester hydrolase
MGLNPAGVKPGALKDEAWRLELQRYPRRHCLETRYGDMDANAHLNNVALARLFEETRVRTLSLLRATPDTPAPAGDPSSMMIVHVGIDYLAEGRYPLPVEAGLAVTDIGRSSFRLGLGLFQQGRAIALADCAMVNLEARRPAEIGAELRVALEGLRHV